MEPPLWIFGTCEAALDTAGLSSQGPSPQTGMAHQGLGQEPFPALLPQISVLTEDAED